MNIFNIPRYKKNFIFKEESGMRLIDWLMQNGHDSHANMRLRNLEDRRTAWHILFIGIKGLLTESRKRMYKQVRQSKKRSDDNFSDDEGNGNRSKNPWGVLSETWGQNDSVEDTFLRAGLTTEQKSSVKERLGFKNQLKETLPPSCPDESNSESNSGSSDEEWCKRSKILRMRMHADDEEEKMLKKRIKRRTKEVSEAQKCLYENVYLPFRARQELDNFFKIHFDFVLCMPKYSLVSD